MKYSLRPAALLLAALASPAALAASETSSLSTSIATSVGSVSTSLETSSDGSSKTVDMVTEGDYRIVEVAALAERPHAVRLKLQYAADADREAFYLYLPGDDYARAGLAAGQTVTAHARSYGLAFAKADTGAAFFLVLKDEWFGELRAHAL